MSKLKGIVFMFYEQGLERVIPSFQDGVYISESEPGFPEGSWSYDGLHVLEAGGYLTIFDKDEPERIVWEGNCEDFLSVVDGPEGRKHILWVVNQYPATLVKGESDE